MTHMERRDSTLRVLGAQGDRSLSRLLRGLGRLLDVRVIGLGWSSEAEGTLSAGVLPSGRIMLGRLLRNRACHITRDPLEIEACGLSPKGAEWMAAIRLRADDVAVGLFVSGAGEPSKALKPALRDCADVVSGALADRAVKGRLQICQAQLEHAERLSQMGHWSYDVASGLYDYSPMARKLTGVPQDCPAPDVRISLANVVVEDIPAIGSAFADLQAEPGKVFACEYRVVGASGAPRILSSIVGGRADEHGALATVTGVCRDITEEHEALKALELSEAHFRRLAETSGDVIVCYTPLGVVTYVSPSVRKVLGYEEGELIGRTIEFVMTSADRSRAIDRFQALVRGQALDLGEAFVYRVLRKDGAAIWLESRPQAVRDPKTGRAVEIRDSLRDVTLRITAETALREQERKFQLLAEVSTDLIVRFSTDGVILYASPASEKIMGLPPTDLVGRKTWDFIHPDDHKLVMAWFVNLLKQPHDQWGRFEYRMVQRSGAIRYVEANPSPILDASTGEISEFFDVVRDVTERRIGEMALKTALERAETAVQRAGRSEAKYRLLAETARDLTIQHDARGVIRYASPSSRHLGYDPNELIGCRLEDFVHPEDLPAARLVSRLNLTLGPDEPPTPVEVRVLCKGGEYVWLEGSQVVIRGEGGQIVMVNSAFRDVTERRKLVDSLVAARVQAEAAAAAKTVFLANMSHELRTPLTSVIGFSQQILSHAGLPASVQKAADRVVAGGRTLLTTINDILDFTKIGSGDIPLIFAPTNIGGLVSEVVELLGLSAEQKGLALDAFAEEGLPSYLSLDVDRLRQVLINLTGNAIKFTEAGSVNILIRYDREAQRLRTEVTDTGAGIAPDKIARLFRRFSQVDDTISRKYGGSGLGLAICKGLVEAMGGEIGVSSTLGEGSVFWFEISAPIAEAPALLGVDGARALPEGTRILLIDDHPDNLEVLTCILGSAGACVWRAGSAEEGLAHAANGAYDIIVTDRRMPVMDGLEFARRIRSTPGPNRYTALLLCTADQADLEPAEVSLFDAIMTKPINAANLIGRVLSLVDQDAITDIRRERRSVLSGGDTCSICSRDLASTVDHAAKGCPFLPRLSA